MRVLVTGSRNYDDKTRLFTVLDRVALWEAAGQVAVVHGDCKSGADALAQEWVELRGHHSWRVPADWKTHGRKAGPIRNQEMVDEYVPDVCLAFWDGESKGTLDCIKRAVKAGIHVRIFGVK